MEYYNERVLLALGNLVGRALKVDNNTHLTSRGKFARVCVEIDLNKPIVPKLFVDDRWINVEYEGLPLFCFHCGIIGHKSCKELKEELMAANSEQAEISNKEVRGDVRTENVVGTREVPQDVPEESAFGPWMVASTRRQRGPTRKFTAPVRNPSVTRSNGSRFAALAEEEFEVPDRGQSSSMLPARYFDNDRAVHSSRGGRGNATSRVNSSSKKRDPRLVNNGKGQVVSQERPIKTMSGQLGNSKGYEFTFFHRDDTRLESETFGDMNNMMVDSFALGDEEELGEHVVQGHFAGFPTYSDHRNRNPPNSHVSSMVPETQLEDGNMLVDHDGDVNKQVVGALPGKPLKPGALPSNF